MQVRVDEARKATSQQLGRLERHLETRDEVDVERVDVANQRTQLRPGPGGDAAAHLLAAPLRRFIAERHAVVGLGDFHKPGDGWHVVERANEFIRFRGEIAAHFDERHELPVIR